MVSKVDQVKSNLKGDDTWQGRIASGRKARRNETYLFNPVCFHSLHRVPYQRASYKKHNEWTPANSRDHDRKKRNKKEMPHPSHKEGGTFNLTHKNMV